MDKQIQSSRSGKEKIDWNPQLVENFEMVQEICRNPLKIVVPRRDDKLFIVGDAAPSQGPGIGSKLLIQREGETELLPSFNHGLRMKDNMTNWSPCEVESYNLNQAVKKFLPFIRYVNTKTTVIIDSRPSVLAIDRLEKGQPSTSRRLQDLLANISAENIQVMHMSARLPSPILKYVDFASRNPVKCEQQKCTICEETRNPDVTFFGEVFTGEAKGIEENVPHITISMWRDIQKSSKDLRRAVTIMESGKKPQKNDKRSNEVTKYLRYCTLDKNGIVVAKNADQSQPFLGSKYNRIVIPSEFAMSYTMILHRRYNHPSKAQMIRMFNRRFYMLDAEKVISKVTEACQYPCRAIKQIPKETYEYQTDTIPERVGVHFNADVLQESKQKLLVIRENLTSYTDAILVTNETKEILKEAMLILLSRLRVDQQVTVRVDSQSALKALRTDKEQYKENIVLDIGTAKNKNKNSVAEKAIREL